MSFINKIVPYKLVLLKREIEPLWRKFTKQNFKQKTAIPILHLHLTDHCNLNCRGCDNFSPLSPAVFANLTVFENDCKRIAELANGKVDEIQLLGGEPLLHPNITAFFAISRKYFPATKICVVSNGILLPKQNEEFWNSCKQHNISIIVTKYPIKLDFKSIESLAKSKDVAFSFYGNTELVDKSMQCLPLDIEGKQDAKDSFLRCSRANRCVSLDNGKIYTCSLIPYAKYFNKQFDKDLKISDQDSIDIYQAKNLDEILRFTSRPMPFCKYCNLKGVIWDIGFGISKKEITEWTGK